MSSTKPAEPAAKRRLPVWAWVLIALCCFIPILLLSPVVAPIALVVLITAVIGLAKGSRTWLRLSSRRAAIGVVAVAGAVLLITGSVSASMLSRDAGDDAIVASDRVGVSEELQAASSTPTPTPTPTPETTVRQEVVTEEIAFKKKTVEDPELPRGESQVTVDGQNGVQEYTYRITLVDGIEADRELVSEEVTVPPTTEVTTVGTYDAPPPPSASQCDPNYADACVPIASDVDCAWGTGDGPAYLDGVARVVGSDVYGLDRNGDGYACER